MKISQEAGTRMLEGERMVMCKRLGYPFYAPDKAMMRAAVDIERDGDEDYEEGDEEVAKESQIRTRGAGEREGKILQAEKDREEAKNVAWDEVFYLTLKLRFISCLILLVCRLSRQNTRRWLKNGTCCVGWPLRKMKRCG
jgi:hypothetical protein